MITLPLLSWVVIGAMLGGLIGFPSIIFIPENKIAVSHANAQEATQ